MTIERIDVIKTIFIFTQLACFITIFGLQFYYGTGVAFVQEWVKAIWCLVVSILIVLSVYIKKVRNNIPFLKKEWKIGVTVFIITAFGFREQFSDIRSLISLALLVFCVCFIVLTCILPESRPVFFETEEIKVVSMKENVHNENALDSFNQNEIKYSGIINDSQT